MKKYNICIIGVYFGKLPQNFNLWLKSCEYNKTIDFMLCTDQSVYSPIPNLKIIKMSLNEFRHLADLKLSLNTMLFRPYKCCDFKPVYGIILEDYLKKYDFWGHCDLDLIFGDLRQFFTYEILEKFDKIYSLGHLSLYRNNIEVNNRYMCAGSLCGDYLEAFTKDKSIAFDEENGITNIYRYNKFPIYDRRDFADISKIYSRFRLSLKDINYKYQVFYWEEGKVYRAYIKNSDILTEEFCYIHFKERKFKLFLNYVDNINAFYINQFGFAEKKIGLPNIEEIKKYNKFKGIIFEKTEYYIYLIKYYYNALKRKMVRSR